MKRTLHKALSILLTAAMVLNMGLTPVFAEGVPIGASGLTDCHTAHDSECGYGETVTMGGCTHEHDGDCGYTEGTAEQPCTFKAEEDAEASPADAVEHEHDEVCGYAPATEGTPCTHEHDDVCGYGETITVTSPCTHTCEVCEGLDSGKPQEKVCICPPVDSGELVHGEDCPLFVPVLMNLRAGEIQVATAEAFTAAIDSAATGDTIKLTDSFEMSAVVTIAGKAITLDLNEKTLTAGAAESRIWVEETGALTLSDSAGGGTITGTEAGLIVNEGRLTMTGGTVENMTGTAIRNQGTGTLIVTGGEVIAPSFEGTALANTSSGSITVGGNAKISGEGNVIFNADTGTINISGGTVNATSSAGIAIANAGTGTINVTGGEVRAVQTAIYNGNSDREKRSGTVNVTGGKVVSTGDSGTAILNNSGDAFVGGTAEVLAEGNDYCIAINNGGGSEELQGVVTVGGEAVVKATGNGSVALIAIINQGLLTVEGNAVVEADGTEGIAIENMGGMCTVRGGRVTAPNGIAIGNHGELDIYGGEIGSIFSGGSIYVYPSQTPPANTIGLPAIFGTGEDVRVLVAESTSNEFAAMLAQAAAAVPSATFPDAGDLLGFFTVAVQVKNADGDWVDGTLPEGAALVLPFPKDFDKNSDYYKVLHFQNGVNAPPEVLDATGREYGIECSPTSGFGSFMAAKFVRYKVTFDANGGTVTPASAGTNTNGKLALSALPAPTRDGYNFNGWFTASTGGEKVTIDTTYTADTTIYAHWKVRTNGDGGNGNGGGSSDGGTGGSGNNQDTITPPNNTDAKVPADVDKNGNATATVKEQDIADAIKKAQNSADKNGIAVNIKLESGKTINSFAVTLPKAIQKQLVEAKVRAVIISSGNLSITFDRAALSHILTATNADVTVTATKTVNTSLSKEAQAVTGGRPVYDFKVTGGGKNITTFGNGKLSLSIPYELQKVDGNGKPSETGSFENPGNLVGVYIDASGKPAYLPGSSYNVANKAMLINTTHLSLYGVAYKTNAPIFTDIANHWAKDDIDFVAARGLLTGTTATTFSPNTSMTRGMFVTALTTLSGKDMTAVVGGNMADTVTREEMAVIMQSYANAIGYKLPSVHKEISFTDSAKIGTWAKTAVKEMQMAGILQGRDGGKFDPTGTATRAEVSAMLRRFVELVANSETAEGWVQNDSGNWMYFEDGKAVTGKKTIDGTTYEFDQYGVTAILPKDRRFTLYTVQKGDSFWAIASKYKVNIFELVSLGGKTIFSMIQPGDELKIPQK